MRELSGQLKEISLFGKSAALCSWIECIPPSPALRASASSQEAEVHFASAGGLERHILRGKKEKKCEVLSITLDFHTLQPDFLKQINENLLFFHLKPMNKAS